MNKTHFDLQIKGRVQGVWYRKTCAETAKSLGIFGFVKNMPDGSVYCEAEGDIEKLMEFISWCEKGPSKAEVEHVLKITGPVKDYTDFTIK